MLKLSIAKQKLGRNCFHAEAVLFPLGRRADSNAELKAPPAKTDQASRQPPSLHKKAVNGGPVIEAAAKAYQR